MGEEGKEEEEEYFYSGELCQPELPRYYKYGKKIE